MGICINVNATVVELADTLGLSPNSGNRVRVQIPPVVLSKCIIINLFVNYSDVFTFNFTFVIVFVLFLLFIIHLNLLSDNPIIHLLTYRCGEVVNTYGFDPYIRRFETYQRCLLIIKSIKNNADTIGETIYPVSLLTTDISV